jgi:hypothetical protein
MAWQQTVTTAGLGLLAGAFGKTPNITRVALGSGSVLVSELQEQTDVTDFVKNLAITSITSSGSRSILRAQLTNAGLETPTMLTQLGVFAKLDDDAEVLLVIFQNDTPSTIPSPGQQAGYSFETEMQIAHANVASFTANIDWGAYASISQLNDSVNSAVAEAMSVYGDLFGPAVPGPVSDFWTRAPGDGNKLRPLSLDGAKTAILGIRDIESLNRRLERAEDNIGEIILVLDARNIYPGYSHMLLENFNPPDQIDMYSCDVISVVAGDDSLDCIPLAGMIPGSMYTLTDGINFELVQVKSVSLENGIQRVILESLVVNTYRLGSCRLYRTSALIEGGKAHGPTTSKMHVWAPASGVWQGAGADAQFDIPLAVSVGGSYETSGEIAITSDGMITL